MLARRPASVLILALLPALALAQGRPAARPAGDVPAGYERRTILGFTVLANRDVLDQPRDRYGRKPLDVLEMELYDLKRVVVPPIFKVLQRVPVWAEWDKRDPGMANAVARYWGYTPEALEKVGQDARKAGTIEVMTLKSIGELRYPGAAFQQIILLHEMSHAVHDRLLGWHRPDVKAAYQQAVDRKLYDEVNDRYGRRGKAYARTNEMEYFAELSCAYLDTCVWFPFTFDDLKHHDPVGFKLMERVWKHPEQFEGMVPPDSPLLSASKSASPASTVTERRDVYAERDALLRLDKLRLLLNDKSKAEQVRSELQALVKTFPATTAAQEARQLLAKMK
jgi:hypothetical protein